MLSLVAKRLLRGGAAARVLGGARSFSAKAEAGALSTADITKMFLDIDAAATAAAVVDLPLKLTGRSGALVGELYGKTIKTKGAFDKAAKELESFVHAVRSAGLVVERFFTTANYSPEENKLVLDLLLTSKEPLTSFESIKNADVKELIVDNESNLDTWRNVRKAVLAIGLSEDVKAILESLAAAGRLDLVKRTAEKAAELRAVASKAVDAVVTSAVPLSKEQQAAVTKQLPTYAPAGTALNITFSVEPAILGGLLISIKNQTIDLSATSRLVEVISSAVTRKLA